MVTRQEFESAVAALVACIEEPGVEVVEWNVDPDCSYGYATTGDPGGVESLCAYSYLDRIQTELSS